MSWDVDSVHKLKCLECGNIGTITESSNDWGKSSRSFIGGFTEREFPGRKPYREYTITSCKCKGQTIERFVCGHTGHYDSDPLDCDPQTCNRPECLRNDDAPPIDGKRIGYPLNEYANLQPRPR
jgi:hypothetical protein